MRKGATERQGCARHCEVVYFTHSTGGHHSATERKQTQLYCELLSCLLSFCSYYQFSKQGLGCLRLCVTHSRCMWCIQK